MASANKTTDHAEIRRWVEARGGHPAKVGFDRDHRPGGILRVAFEGPANTGECLERISWEEFFDIFDTNGLAFLYRDDTSRFNKLVSRRDEDG